MVLAKHRPSVWAKYVASGLVLKVGTRNKISKKKASLFKVPVKSDHRIGKQAIENRISSMTSVLIG